MQIVSVDGDVVTADLVAQQTDGTVKTFEGTYTVEDGTTGLANTGSAVSRRQSGDRTAGFDVRQTDGAPTDGE
ncbi:MAG TPA: hypothetical protein VFI65_09260 [Streptosporangiaceae bacterium]|nr:hypothetical protein [Streptosporangiaceae bacterium]